jgi:hypothetical protein
MNRYTAHEHIVLLYFDLEIHFFPLLPVTYVTSIMYELLKETRILTDWKVMYLVFFFISSELHRKIPVGQVSDWTFRQIYKIKRIVTKSKGKGIFLIIF